MLIKVPLTFNIWYDTCPMVDYFCQGLDMGNESLLVLFAISVMFDTIDHAPFWATCRG